MRNVKAILIDPFACTVTEIEHDADDYTGIYGLLSHESMRVGCFTAINLDGGDAIFIDDEGLLKSCDRFFVLNGKDYRYHQALAGKGLVIGSDQNGDTMSVKTTADKVRANVSFWEPDAAGLIFTRKPWVAPEPAQ